MDRRNFLKGLGVVAADAVAGVTPAVGQSNKTPGLSSTGLNWKDEQRRIFEEEAYQARLADQAHMSAPDGVGFLAQEIMNFHAGQPILNGDTTQDAVGLPYGVQPISMWIGGTHKGHRVVNEPRILVLLEDLRRGWTDRIEQVCQTLWEIGRKNIDIEVYNTRLEGKPEQVDFLPKVVHAEDQYKVLNRHPSMRISTPKYVCDMAELNTFGLALALTGPLSVADEVCRKICSAKEAIASSPVPSTHIFLRHTPCRTFIEQKAWMAEIFHYAEMCGVLTRWKIK